jgi:integrase
MDPGTTLDASRNVARRAAFSGSRAHKLPRRPSRNPRAHPILEPRAEQRVHVRVCRSIRAAVFVDRKDALRLPQSPAERLVNGVAQDSVRLHDLRHTGPSVLLMQGIPGDIVRKITGHRSRELERYQHLSPLFRAQTVDLIAHVLVGDTPTDTPAPEEEQDDANLFQNGGVDGTRTRDLRRDRPAF